MAALPPSAAEVGLREDAVVVYPGEGQAVYRILAGAAPVLRDFQSHLERGETLRRRQSALDFTGLSMFASPDQAIAMAQRFPKIGHWIAALSLESGQISLARTG